MSKESLSSLAIFFFCLQFLSCNSGVDSTQVAGTATCQCPDGQTFTVEIKEITEMDTTCPSQKVGCSIKKWTQSK